MTPNWPKIRLTFRSILPVYITRRHYCTMLKYFLVLAVFIGLVSILFRTKNTDTDQRVLEDRGEPTTCCYLQGGDHTMCPLKSCLVGDRIIILSNEATANKRILIIGDVHGCLTQLSQLLLDAGVLKTGDLSEGLKEDALVIFVGDLVNKGPSSYEVLDFVMKTEGVYTVLGNHECYWLNRGLMGEYTEMVNKLPFIISIPRYNALIVHAGLHSDLPLAEQNAWEVVHMRNMELQGDGTYVGLHETISGVHWATLWKGPEHIYFGHDARRGRDEAGNPRVQRFPLVTGLDTRCVKGGALTGVILPLENEEFYSVSCPIKYSD